MFFVRGHFLLIPSKNGPDDVLDSTLSNSKEIRPVIIPFLSYREARRFVFSYIKSLGFKIKKRRKYPRYEEFYVGNRTQNYYNMDILEVNPASAKEWQKIIDATAQYNNTYR